MSSYGSRMKGLASGHKPCPCGRKAIKFKCGGFVCKECDEIEDRMLFADKGIEAERIRR